MKRSNIGIIAVTMIIAILLNMFGSVAAPVYAEMSFMDKLIQNERIINVQDKSYSYKDIASHWAKDGIYKLSYMEILTGFPDGTMRPDKTLTREEFIVMLVRAIELPLSDTYQQYYEDIGVNHWSYKYIQGAKAAGLLDIYWESRLYPTKTITREDMAVIAANVVRDVPQTGDSRSFKDLSSSYRHMDSIRIVTGLDIIKGLPDGRFMPYSGATRAEAAVIIQRILDVKLPISIEQEMLLKMFIEDYEKSSMTNPTLGTLSRQSLLDYSIGKERKQNIQRTSMLDSFNMQGINLDKTIEDVTVNVSLITKYLAEAAATYKLSFTTQDGITRDYKVTRKLDMKKVQDKWVVYNSSAVYSNAYAIDKTQKINLTWHYMGQRTPVMTNTSKIEGLNVISPTWFNLINADGTIKSIGDVNYTNWAHKNGYQVWALIHNDFHADMTSKMLNNPAAREKTINMLIKYAKDYKLDGINVDFENMYIKDKAIFTQFVKELYAKTKPLGIILSVDVTVIVSSSNWSECYDRKALAQVSDYIALMAYDQYWAGSPVSGSVAQLKWVEDHLKKVLLQVPKEKLLLGVPFYTRVWKEEYDASKKLVVTSSAVSMQTAEQLIAENKAAKTWDPVSGQYFATYVKNGATYKIWLEDERSIALKTELVNKYNLAGVASWRMGFEKPSIWGVIASIIKR